MNSPLRGRYLVRNPVWNGWLRLNDFIVGMLHGAAVSHPDIGQPKRILLAIGGHLGDAVIATAILEPLSRAFQGAEIGVLCASWNRRVFESHPRLRWIHVVDHWKLNRGTRSWWARWRATRATAAQALAEIRGVAYDVAVDLSAYYPNAARLLWRAGIPVRIGYRSGGDGPLYTHPVFWTMRDHISAEHRALLEPFTAFSPTGPATYELADIPSESAKGARAKLTAAGLRSSEYVVVHMAAGQERKEWPVDAWISVIRELSAVGVPCVLTGAGDAQKALGVHVADVVPGTMNLWDKLEWNEFRAVIAGARLVLSVDTVAMHLAGAAGTPCVALMTGMDRPKRWRALGSEMTILSQPVPCAPCFRSRGCGHMSCVREIASEDVVAAARRHIAQPLANAGRVR